MLNAELERKLEDYKGNADMLLEMTCEKKNLLVLWSYVNKFSK